ncbi:MAG: ABC transporter substrate-binding protein [Actinobacteria bacterium]|nr:ABC transporter substrate-binding protein [Actinomycetota bacterium]
MSNLTRGLGTVVAALLAAVSLTACGGGGAVEGAGGSNGAGGGTSGATRTFAYATDQQIISDWDPAKAYVSEAPVLMNAYETLTRYDSRTRRIVPLLATKLVRGDGGRTWSVDLRSGVKFHTGRPLTAEAVREAILRTRDAKAGASYIWGSLTRIDVRGALRLVLHFSVPARLDVIASSNYGAYIYDVKAAPAARLGAWFSAGHDAGTGPYRVTRYDAGQDPEVRMAAADDYWGGWKPTSYRSIVFRVVSAPTTAVRLLRAGDVTFLAKVPSELWPSLASAHGIATSSTGSFENLFAQMNTASGALADLRVRRAIALGIDYKAIVGVLHGSVMRQGGFIPDGVPGHVASLPSDASYQPAEAARLLSEAGYGQGGKRLPLTLFAFSGDSVADITAKLLQSQLAKLNVQLSVRTLDYEAAIALAGSADEAKRPDMMLFHWFPDLLSPLSWFTGMFETQAPPPTSNFSYFSDPQVDREIAEAKRLSGSDPAAAEKVYVELQNRIQEQMPAAVLYTFVARRAFSTGIEGYVDNPAYANVVFVHDLTAR